MQFSWVWQLPHATVVVVMRHFMVMVFEKQEVIDKTGRDANQYTTSRDTGMIDTARDCRCCTCMHVSRLTCLQYLRSIRGNKFMTN